MKLRTKYILFIALLELVCLALSFYVFKENRIYFIISEVFIIITIVLAIQLYYQLLLPLKTLMSGIDALRSRDFNVKFRPTGKYEMDQLISIYNEMIEKIRIERTQQEQQHYFLEKLINTSPTGIIILDHNNKIEQINPKALQILGVNESELKGKLIEETTNVLLQNVASLKSGASKTLSTNGINTYKVQSAHFIDRGFPRNFLMIEELTTEILEAEKNVYGKVIRMMAHEVNNTIGPVNSIINSTLKANFIETSGSELRNALNVAIRRNNNLNSFMRNFADLVKLPQPTKKKVDLNKIINNVAGLMAHRANEKGIKLSFNIEDGFLINADEEQMEQALINIIKNSIEAIESTGIINIELNKRKSRLIVRDTGKGISSTEAEQLFSPFFSTKRDGQGIGLTLVREILINHGFEFSLKTIHPGQTDFTIFFSHPN
jgi:PAS domain S-box